MKTTSRASNSHVVASALAAVLSAGTLPAATIDTTGGTTVMVNTPEDKFTGNGTLQVSSTVWLDEDSSRTATEFAMTGGLITIDGGATLVNGGWQKGVWTENLAGMHVDGVFDIWDGNPVRIDALTGSGSVVKAHGGNSPTLLTVGVNHGGGTFGGTIANASGQIALTKVGAGTQILTGANTYTGVTTISAGTLVAANNTALGAGGFNGATMTFIQDGATLALQGGVTLDEHFHVWGAGIGGLGAVRSIGGHNALTSSYLGGAGYALRSDSTIGVDADSLTVTGFYGELGGGFGLTKVGAGTLIFTAASSYSGATNVEDGILLVNGIHSSSGLITVSAAATFGGGGQVGDVDLWAAGTLAPGDTARGDNWLNVGALSLGDAATVLDFELGAPDDGGAALAANDLVIASSLPYLRGLVNVAPQAGFSAAPPGSKWRLIELTAGTVPADNELTLAPALASQYTLQALGGDTAVYLVAVPEAGTAGLVGLGLLFLRRMKRNRHPADYS